ncbi:MAG: hypothetical protein P1P88_01080 [Bacteroidales bacterium]|nr:hypothetical protein [Bacteroidales bacterium]
MKTILIIYPHWPPSNLAGVHRARLIANFLPELGWLPVVLTVHPDYYEEQPDWDMLKTVSEQIEVQHVNAKKIRKPRIIGDIGLRAFSSLKKAALGLIKTRRIDFIWIPIPSFYLAVLGRILYNQTKIPYGIDYIDPWVRDISNRKNFRAILSNLTARILEPYAVKKATLISGVSSPYYQPVLDRNFKNKLPKHVGMPYGFDPNDHQIKIESLIYPWNGDPECIPYIYAGAFLPKSDLFIELLFKAINKLKEENKWNDKIKLYFIGTGNYSHKSITQFALENKVNEQVIEIRDRFPFLHVLNFLSAAKGVLLIGSTEKHYTASKTYQSLLSGRPVFSILHSESTAVDVFRDCKAVNYLCEYVENETKELLLKKIKQTFLDFIEENKLYQPDLKQLEKYSAKKSAEVLVKGIDKVI